MLEKSQFIDKERLQKYLKGRQHQGSADNLPVLASQKKEEETTGSSGGSSDNELVYRALVELRTDISDVKKMLANFLYSTFTSKDVKALPDSLPREFDPNDISSHLQKRMDESLGVSSIDDIDVNEPKDETEDFFGNDEIPSIEEAEKFLIQKALVKFEGNRRKASEALGVSERTLYRKLDQYDLQ